MYDKGHGVYCGEFYASLQLSFSMRMDGNIVLTLFNNHILFDSLFFVLKCIVHFLDPMIHLIPWNLI